MWVQEQQDGNSDVIKIVHQEVTILAGGVSKNILIQVLMRHFNFLTYVGSGTYLYVVISLFLPWLHQDLDLLPAHHGGRWLGPYQCLWCGGTPTECTCVIHTPWVTLPALGLLKGVGLPIALVVLSVRIPVESVCFRRKVGCKKMERFRFHSEIPKKLHRKP